MQNLATLSVLGFWKHPQPISRSEIWGYTNFHVNITIFMEINWKNNIWQPCNAKSGNPVGRRVSKISSFNFLCQIRGYRKFGAYFHDKKLKTKRYLSGNPVMQKLATLSVVWFRKCPRLSYHLKIRTYTDFQVSVVSLKVIIWKEHYLATLHCRIWQPCWL